MPKQELIAEVNRVLALRDTPPTPDELVESTIDTVLYYVSDRILDMRDTIRKMDLPPGEPASGRVGVLYGLEEAVGIVEGYR
jgi:hypothetical protein